MSLIIYILGTFLSEFVYVGILVAMYLISEKREKNSRFESNAVSTMAYLVLGALIWPVGIFISVFFLLVYWLTY